MLFPYFGLVDYKWQLAENPDPDLVSHMKEVLGVEDRIAQLLVKRGVHTYDEARAFFKPELADLHDPFLMKDMDRAVDRIQQALEEDQRILIYGDYDVDGTTSVALMVTFFRFFFKDNIDYYIPDRYKEGYGVSFEGVDYAEDNDIELIIALDCGIRAHDKVKNAHEKGIDFIICDHHIPHGDLPKAVAVLDHKRSDCPYPYKELSGCGIGLKLCQALSLEMNLPEEWWQSLLDLVAISTACDIVPLTGENRALTYLGLQRINRMPRKGIAHIIEQSNKAGKFTVGDLVFILGPRINAAGRIEHGKKAVDLLLSENAEIAQQASEIIEARNVERRALDQSITLEALDMMSKEDNEFTTVLYSDSWHKGVVGIVASRLIENHYRPTIVLTESQGEIVGSARSVKGFDIHEALLQCEAYLDQFGGHAFAAGMTLERKNLEGFKEQFEKVVANSILPEQRIPVIEVDEEIDFQDITPKFWRLIKRFAPFGPGNMKPIFKSTKVIDAGWSKPVGDGTHLKLNVKQIGKAGKISGIAFRKGELAGRIQNKEPFDVLYTIEENEWNGRVNLQIVVEDIKFLTKL